MPCLLGYCMYMYLSAGNVLPGLQLYPPLSQLAVCCLGYSYIPLSPSWQCVAWVTVISPSLPAGSVLPGLQLYSPSLPAGSGLQLYPPLSQLAVCCLGYSYIPLSPSWQCVAWVTVIPPSLPAGSVLLFVTRKSNSEEVASSLKSEGHQLGLLHGDMTQGDRDDVITAFRRKEFPILVATDVAG